MMKPEEQHFATLSEDEIGDALQLRIERYYDEIRTTGLLTLWRRSYNAFYKATDHHKGRLQTAGEQNEFTKAFVNHYRSLLQHKASITIKDRPAYEPVATNTDHRSQQQTILAKGLLEYYSKEKGLETKLKRAVEFSLRYGEAFVRAIWDAGAGETYAIDPASGKSVAEGDIEYEALAPIDVIRDTSVDDCDSNDWYIVRTFKNKFDLIAQYATLDETEEEVDDEIAQEIEKLRTQILTMPTKDQVSRDGLTISDSGQETDLVPVYEFYHRKTPAVPNGRVTTFLDAETILIDGDLPYRKIPIHPLFASEIDGTPFGYTVGFDILPLQEAVDGLHSAVITNQKTFAVQLVALPRGSGISEATIGEGLSVLFYEPANVPGGGLPQAVNLTATPQEVFNYIKELESLMEVLSGINQVTRGTPPPSLKSGASLALVQSMAIDFASDFQNSYVRLLESVGTASIDLLKTYAKTERVATIVGKNNQTMLASFVGADMENVNRVTVTVGNPLATTTAGKLAILEQLMQAGLITTHEQYLEVLQTGKLAAATEGETAELLLIRSENEMLSDGATEVIAVATDAHSLHIKEHKSVLASPDARMDGNIVASTLAHIQEHINLLSSTDPNLLQMMGQQSLAQPLAPPGGGDINAPIAAPEMEGAMGVGEVNGVNLPQMPQNPLTGETFEPQTPGLPQ